jgi:hypothetical protein
VNLKLVYSNQTLFFFILFFLINLISFIFSPSFWFLEFFQNIILFIISYFLAQYIEFDDFLRTNFHKVIIFGVAIIALFSPITLLLYSSYGDVMKRAGGLGVAPNDLSILCFAVFISSNCIKNKYQRNFVVFSTIMGIFFSASRKALFSLLIYFIFKSKRTFFITISFLFLLYLNFDSLVVWVIEYTGFDIPLISRFASFVIDSEDSTDVLTDEGRSSYYQIFVSQIANNLFLGAYAIPMVASKYFHLETMHFHNVFFQWTMMFGLIGCIILIGWLFSVFFKIWHNRNDFIQKDPSTVYYILFICFVLFNQFDYSFYNPKLTFIFLLIGNLILRKKSISNVVSSNIKSFQ